MTVYCVSYDLRKPNRDYTKLYDKLKGFNGYSHALESTWFVCSDKEASDIRDDLSKVIDDDDQLIVIRVTSGWASRNLGKGATDWLKQHL